MSRLTYDKDQFYLDGEPFQILSGSIHYFRVMPQCWEDRLRKLKECGFNTVETYVCWNLHERREGSFDFTGRLDLARFLQIAQELGLHAILRPGPYICAEWEMGGLPSWLLTKPGLKLRCDNEPYLTCVRRFFQALFTHLESAFAAKGGPILAVQVENEYGSYGNDHIYMQKILDMYKEYGLEELFFTSDGPGAFMLNGGTLPGVLATANFGSNPKDNLAYLKSFQPDAPVMCTEFWNGWFDSWNLEHHEQDSVNVSKIFEEMIQMGASVNFYMFHGGTNFGLWNGANYDEHYRATVTSYDYGAPVNESGDLTPNYYQAREVIEKHKGKLPPLTVTNSKKTAYGRITLTETAPLWQNRQILGGRQTSPCPMTMEELGLDVGCVLYETTLTGPYPQMELNIDGLADRAIIFQDGKLLGVKENTGKRDDPIHVDIKTGEQTTISILVENLGRVNYGGHIMDHKGISRGVRLANQYLFGWTMTTLTDTYPASLHYQKGMPKDPAQPCFYRGTFQIPEEPTDTFVQLQNFQRGWIYINNYLLGRHNQEGPQHTLYLPAEILHQGENELVVLELEKTMLPNGESPYASLVAEPILSGIHRSSSDPS